MTAYAVPRTGATVVVADEAETAHSSGPETSAALPRVADSTEQTDRLQARLEAMRAKAKRPPLYSDEIPGWDFLVVKLRPLDPKITRPMWDADPTAERESVIARIFAQFCEGVYLKDDDGQLVSADITDPNGPAPKFDKRLADLLDLPWMSAEHLVLGMYDQGGGIALNTRYAAWVEANQGNAAPMLDGRKNV